MRRIDKEEVRRNLIELRQLTLEVMDDCNLSCRYCGYGEMYEWYDERQSKYLRFGQIEKLLDFLTGLWNSNESVSSNPHTFISFYGGEPLLNMPLIRQVVDYMEQSPAGRRFRYSMTTNAVCLDKEMDYLVEKGFRLLISIDGDSYASSYQVRKDGRASFGKVVKNISLLRERYPDFYERNVSFNSVLHDRNSVGGIRKYLKEIFGKTGTIAELNNSGVREDKKDLFEKTYRNKQQSLQGSGICKALSKEMFLEVPAIQSLWSYLRSYSGNFYFRPTDLLKEETEDGRLPTGTCTPFAKKMFVTVNGKLLPCERINHVFSCGTVSEEGLHLDEAEIAKQYNACLDKMEHQCSACSLRKGCGQCLYYIEGMQGESPVCRAFMNAEDFRRYESSCLSCLVGDPALYLKLMQEVVVE